MPEHRYQQYCALARTLDVVGSRWTLLIVRELVPGPRRFTDLVDGLPGISRKLLSDRLRDLEQEGLITRKELPPPAARQVYELTVEGRDLAKAIGPLIAWGAGRLEDRLPEETFHPRWAGLAMVSLADREAAVGVNEIYQYVIGDSAFHFVVDDGSIEVRDGYAENPSLVVTTDEDTWFNLVSGKAGASSLGTIDSLSVTGDRRAVKRLGKIFPVDWRSRGRPRQRESADKAS